MDNIKIVIVNRNFPSHLLPDNLIKITMYPKNYFNNLTSLNLKVNLYLNRICIFTIYLTMSLTVKEN